MVRLLVAVGLSIGGALPVMAQSMCSSAQGLCPANAGPPGAPCLCFGPTGPVPGRLAATGGGGSQRQGLSNSCRTARGFCQTSPAPTGSPCGCSGDYGTVVLR